MRTLHFGISWKRFVALVLLPFFAINTLSVSLVTAASGDEYLTGSTEPIVEMIAPNIWLDAALAERTGSTEQITTESGSTAIGEDSTGATLSGEISTGATLEPEIVSDTGSMIADDTSLSGATLSGETLT